MTLHAAVGIVLYRVCSRFWGNLSFVVVVGGGGGGGGGSGGGMGGVVVVLPMLWLVVRCW